MADEEREARHSEDRRLMAALAQGDPKALDGLYARYSSRLFPVARRILSDPSEAEDCLLDVFIEIWERPHRYDGGRATPATYLNTLTRSRAIDRLRARERRRRTQQALRLELLHAPNDDPSPLDALADARERERFESALRELDASQRVPIEMAYFEGLSQSEVAERLGAPLGTVKTRTRRGLEQLRRRLAGEGGAPKKEDG